jgi:hypothetical protein
MYISFGDGCCDSRRRMDLWTILDNILVAVEIDEHLHLHGEHYMEGEGPRYNDIWMDAGMRALFIRINPDAYWGVGPRIKSNRRNPPDLERVAIVEARLQAIFTPADRYLGELFGRGAAPGGALLLQ